MFWNIFPPKIWKLEQVSRGYETAVLTIYHDIASDLLITSASYELAAIYEYINENVSQPCK